MGKVYSAPVPNRAASDPRLATLHFRVLVEVAAHDRMSRNGLGYLLSTRRMAERLGHDYSNVAAAIRSLIQWGYLAEYPHPTREHRQARMLVILYSDADREFIETTQQNRGAKKPRSKASNSGAQPPRSRIQTVVADPETVVERPDFHEENQPFPHLEDTHLKVIEDIPLKAARHASREARHRDDEIGHFDPVENPAPWLRWEADEPGITGMLARLERAFKADPESIGDIGENIAWLETLYIKRNDAVAHQAERLLGLLEACLRDQGR